jgi:hypothetical protein
VEILLPRTRQRATPIAWILAGAAILIGVTFVYVIAERSGHPPVAPHSPAPPPPSLSAPPPAAAPGPLDVIDTDLRRIVERTLSDYGRALERADADLLARARPDLTPAERQQRLAPFLSALNAATDIRVLDVAVRGNEAVVTILFTPVIVDGRQLRAAPTEEELRFARRGGVWFLRERRAAGKP